MIRPCSTLAALFLFFLPGFCESLHAQDYNPVVKYYVEQSGGFSPLYNWKIPPRYTMLHDGTYFLESEEYCEGTVVYNGKLYVDLVLNLNAHLDELYIKMPQYNAGSVLLKAHVESFTLNNRQFINIVNEKWPGAPREGYYRVLFAGEKISVLKKTVKRLNSATAGNELKVSHYFEEDHTYYILKNGFFHPVKRKASLLRILRDSRRELNHHIREQKLGFGKNEKDASLASCAAVYEKETQ